MTNTLFSGIPGLAAFSLLGLRKRIVLVGIGAMLLSFATVERAGAVVVQIGALTQPNIVLDFDAMPAGPTSVAAINAAFPGAGIVDLSFTEAGEGGSTTYNTNTGAGRALKPTADGGLELIDPLEETAGEATSFTIELNRLVTEFGFALADRSSVIDDISFFDGATLVGSIDTVDVNDASLIFLQSTIAFDRVVITEDKDWLIPTLALQIADASDVPAPSTLLLVGLGLVGLAGIGRPRRSA